jgi:DGQHR domain-containing protein
MTALDFQILTELYSKMTGDSDLITYVKGGWEGDRYTYCGKLTFAELTTHYVPVPQTAELPPYLRLQRDLVKSRSVGIRQYVLENVDHIFPEVISISEHIEAEPIGPEGCGLYKIRIPKESFRYLVDGQGRLVGIGGALMMDGTLCKNSIDIKFVLSESVARDSQVFADVNSTPIAPNKSQIAAMDGRLVINQFSKNVVSSISGLSTLIDYSKASVTASSSSNALWTLNQFVSFVMITTGSTQKSFQKQMKEVSQQDYFLGFIAKYFEYLQSNRQFSDAFSGKVSAVDSRKQTIVGTSVFLKSLAVMGKVLLMNFAHANKADWNLMCEWDSIDLTIDNEEWIGRCKNFRGGFEDRSYNHKALASYFLLKMGVQIPEELEVIEEEVLINRAGIKKAQREARKQLESINVEPALAEA